MSQITQGIHALKLWTAGTPNGHKVSILLEELKVAYGLQYDFHGISFSANEQKGEDFVRINPNGRIPALTDYSQSPPVHIFESGAIQLYLVTYYDPENRFHYPSPAPSVSDPTPASSRTDSTDLLSWLTFSQSGVGPMQGQANHFHRYAPERIEYGVKRYQDETKRLYGVLDRRLAEDGRKWIVGSGEGKYTIVDMNLYPWVRMSGWAGVEDMDAFPYLKSWVDRISARPAVKAGLDIPEPTHYNPGDSKEKQDEDAKKAREWIMPKKKADSTSISARSILVTVGSTQFDPLINVVSGKSFLEVAKKAGYESVVIQFGKGTQPRGLSPDKTSAIAGIIVRSFAFSNEIEEDVQSSDLVISHAGSASIISALRAGKQLIVIPNTTLADNHQVELADALEKEEYSAVATLETLTETVSTLASRTFAPFPAFQPERFREIMDEQMGFNALA